MTDEERQEMWKVVTEEFLEKTYLDQPPTCEDIITKLVLSEIDVTVASSEGGKFQINLNYCESGESFETLLDALCHAAMYATLNRSEITPTYLTEDEEP